MEFKKYIPRRHFRHILGAPIIYGLIVPMVVVDICIEIYHRVCFPLYGLKYIPRRRYIRVDRHRLSYLNWYEKINCAYCGYANGLLHYASIIGAATEHYWCSIRHQKKYGFIEPPHHKDFLEYGDKKGLSDFVKGREARDEPINPDQIADKRNNLEWIVEYARTHKKISNDAVEYGLHVSDRTAQRYLSELEKSGILRRVGDTGRYVYYTLR